MANFDGECLAAENYLRALASNGIEFLFCNPGTDFAPIVEAYCRLAANGGTAPKPMVVPHENAAVGMAHGYYMVSGRLPAVMVHVNVGTANSLAALINATRDFVPVLFTSGRTPYTERGPSGARDLRIHWAQEMFDQGAMLREIVKWDYELTRADQAADAVNRAVEVALSSPPGPVYLSLPREVLAERVRPSRVEDRPRRARPSPPQPAGEDIERLADWIAAARFPLIVASGVGRTAAQSSLLARLADRFALPVVSYNARYLSLPDSHPMHQGYDSAPLVPEADLIVAVESDVPWLPANAAPAPGARIVHIGQDPLFARYPMRSFPSDLTIQAEPESALAGLERALASRVPAPEDSLAERRAFLAKRSAQLRSRWNAEAQQAGRLPKITPAWFNHCLRSVVGSDTILVNEYPFRPEYCPLEYPGSYLGTGPAGGLGWGFPAALGAKLADPDKLVIAALGDGAYIFANPTACHWIAAAYRLPTLTVLFNNSLYGAVRRATLALYGNGVASRQNDARLLSELGPSPDFERLVEAQQGYGERAERPEELPRALERAASAVRGGRQALVNVICEG